MAQFCVKCGSPLGTGHFCVKCGADMRNIVTPGVDSRLIFGSESEAKGITSLHLGKGE